MANYRNFRLEILLEEDTQVKDPQITKVSAVPKSTGAEPGKPVNVEIYADDETRGLEYSVLRCPSVFNQTLGELCSDTEKFCLYEHFVLRGSTLLSEYWNEACSENKDRKEGETWSDGSFAIVMKEYKNRVLSGENGVAAGDVFRSFLRKALRKPDDMTPKAFKARFEVLFKLYDDLKADFELTIGEKERNLIFFNAFSNEHRNKFVQQQKNYHQMTTDEIVAFFQVCHATDQPLREQRLCEATAKKERKEANQEKDAADKKMCRCSKKYLFDHRQHSTGQM